jgi:hypothetical protein
LEIPDMSILHRPVGPGNDDPTRNFADLLDDDALARVAGWYYGFGGEVHVTQDDLDRYEADLLMATWSGRKGVARG